VLTWAPPRDATEPPRVAYAVSRRQGSAVARNRARRRLRAAFVELARDGRVPRGAYLASLRGAASEPTSSQLKGDVATCLSKLDLGGGV
jgi:ribonuclease P protein component